MRNEDIQKIARLMSEEVGGVIDLQTMLQTYPSINQVLAKFKVDPQKLRDIGSGDRGTAYSDGKIVVKFTTDEPEAHASYNIAGKNIPGVTPIHASYTLADKGLGEPYFLVIQDLANTNLNQNEKAIANELGEFLTVIDYPFNVDRTATLFFNWVFQKTKRNLIGPSATNMVKQILTAIMNLNKAGVHYFDVSGENVGKDAQGNYIIFDLGISETENAPLPVVEYIMFGRDLPVLS